MATTGTVRLGAPGMGTSANMSVSASVTNTSATEAKITIKVTGVVNGGATTAWVASSGCVVQLGSDTSTRVSLIGNVWLSESDTPYKGGTSWSTEYIKYVTRTTENKSASYTVYVYPSSSWGAGGAGTGSIYDDGKLTLSISATVSAKPSYKVTFNLAGGSRTGGGALEQTIYHGGNATVPTVSRTDYTFAGWSGTYTNVTSARTITATWTKIYRVPTAPGTPVIEFNKTRLTTKENWKYTWTAATAQSSHSPIKGYRIKLYNGGSTVPIVTESGTTLGTNSGSIYYYDTDTTATSITFNPAKSGFKATNTVKLGVAAYSLDGSNVKTPGAFVSSVASPVQNAGIVNVKVGGQWQEGQVWVKADGAWREAETVNVKVNGSWQESI